MASAKGNSSNVCPASVFQGMIFSNRAKFFQSSFVIRRPAGRRTTALGTEQGLPSNFMTASLTRNSEVFHDIMMNTGRVLFVRSARAVLSMVTTPENERVEKLLKTGILHDDNLAEGYRNGGSFTDFSITLKFAMSSQTRMG